eukprot:maker-scaffold_2-snap-gene-14.38-mRNA-1 protein AED:0.01 eAED:0.01 QI:160/1/1/1/1/1/2/451/533
MDGKEREKRNQIAVIDFGSQFSHLIARRLREKHVFCQLYPSTASATELKDDKTCGLILAGGPSSVYDENSPHLNPEIWNWVEEAKIPIFGICYGMQEIVHHFGGVVQPADRREYGFAELDTSFGQEVDTLVLKSVPEKSQVWMSHGDRVESLPDGFQPLAVTSSSPFAMIENMSKKIYAVQFHPEVSHTQFGKQLLENFAHLVCEVEETWDAGHIEENFVNEIRKQVAESGGHVIGAVSGGVDSSVAAVLLHKAIGEKFHAIFVDNGLLRKNEAKEVENRLKNKVGIDLTTVNAGDRFLSALSGITDPEKKRKIIGGEFIKIFEEEAKRISAEKNVEIKFLLQGTLYPDVIESVSYKGPSATIKTHHNVGGLPERMKLKLIEPLRLLFKDEVRELGSFMGMHKRSVMRHPFPGPGLAIRVLGEVTKKRCDVLRECDARLIQEIENAGVYDDIGQAFCVLLPVNSVGVMGDGRTYENVVCVRCVTTDDFMTADWYRMDYKLQAKISSRIINEVQGVNRVCYDISSKPPATIEWE